MADIKSKEERSKNMAAIKNKDTKPEVYLRKLLFNHGYRYRKYSKKIPGHPDLWLRKYNTAIFIHGCFWHRHNGCKYAYMPKSRIGFWNTKFDNNIKRDVATREKLRDNQIRCLVIWECTIRKTYKSPESQKQLIENLIFFLQSDIEYLEI